MFIFLVLDLSRRLGSEVGIHDDMIAGRLKCFRCRQFSPLANLCIHVKLRSARSSFLPSTRSAMRLSCYCCYSTLPITLTLTMTTATATLISLQHNLCRILIRLDIAVVSYNLYHITLYYIILYYIVVYHVTAPHSLRTIWFVLISLLAPADSCV